MQAMLDEFNSTNQWKITVRGEYAGPYDQIYNKMVASIAAGRPPELVVAYQNQAATYDDALVDLNPYVNDPTWGITGELGDFFAGFINQDISAQPRGQELGFPPNRSIEVLFYNEAMLRRAGINAPPRTWDEFAADCRRVTSNTAGTYGYALDSLDASHVFSFVISRGGTFTTPDGRGYALDSPQMRESMLFMRRLVTGGWARKIAKKFDDQSEFGNAQCAFTMSLHVRTDLLCGRGEGGQERAVSVEHCRHPPVQANRRAGYRPVRSKRQRAQNDAPEAACRVALHQVVFRAPPAGGLDPRVPLLPREKVGGAPHQGYPPL